MIFKKRRKLLVLISLLLTSTQLTADDLTVDDNGLKIHGRIQVGAIYNDNSSENVFPTGFLNFDEGINLNRADLIFEKEIKSNIKPRVGPFPGPKPQQSNIGFQIDTRYGKDAAITFGFDDEGRNKEHDHKLLMQQWFLKGYQPWGDGFSYIVGSWFTPLGLEIGAPVDPPTGFYSHSYAFTYSPSKHVGAMGALKLPVSKNKGMFSVGLGVVQGWNNLQDNNDDKTVLFDLRWRSPDFKTWVDFENIIGNEQSEDGVTDQTRPFNAVSTSGKKLLRNMHSLTLSHHFDKTKRMAINAVYGAQEGGDLVADSNNPPGFLITQNSEWYGLNANYYNRFKPNMQLGLRADWLRDDKGAHALLPEGDYYAATANVSWWPTKKLRIRPELRYDQYDGPGKPFGGRVPTVFFGSEDKQWTTSVDATWFFEK